MKKKYLTVKVGLEIERLAREEAERLVAQKMHEAEQLLQFHFGRVVDKFALEIKEAIMDKYMLVEKPRNKFVNP